MDSAGQAEGSNSGEARSDEVGDLDETCAEANRDPVVDDVVATPALLAAAAARSSWTPLEDFASTETKTQKHDH